MSVPVSIITPSYHRDFEACRLLCETLDRYATGFTDHYIVVTSDDLPLFAPLAGPHRHIITEHDVLLGSAKRAHDEIEQLVRAAAE